MRCSPVPEERAAVAAISDRFHGLFLTADLATRVARVGSRRHDASDADAKVAREQEAYDLGTLDWSTDRRVRHAGGHAQACQGCACAADDAFRSALGR